MYAIRDIGFVDVCVLGVFNVVSLLHANIGLIDAGHDSTSQVTLGKGT